MTVAEEHQHQAAALQPRPKTGPPGSKQQSSPERVTTKGPSSTDAAATSAGREVPGPYQAEAAQWPPLQHHCTECGPKVPQCDALRNCWRGDFWTQAVNQYAFKEYGTYWNNCVGCCTPLCVDHMRPCHSASASAFARWCSECYESNIPHREQCDIEGRAWIS